MTQSLQVIISLACVGIIGIASYFYIATVLPNKKKKSNSNNVSIINILTLLLVSSIYTLS